MVVCGWWCVDGGVEMVVFGWWCVDGGVTCSDTDGG